MLLFKRELYFSTRAIQKNKIIKSFSKVDRKSTRPQQLQNSMAEDENSTQSSIETPPFRSPSEILFTLSNNSKFISSKALLLRLFQSELFTAVQALHYLQKYSHEPGIQYYLCERMKELPEEDVEVIVPQLWYISNYNLSFIIILN